MLKKYFCLFILFCFYIVQAFAGAGTNLGFCVYKDNIPNSKPLHYQMRAMNKWCMYPPDNGSEKKLTYKDVIYHIMLPEYAPAGLYCAKEKYYIETKSSSSGGDFCATDDSFVDYVLDENESHTQDSMRLDMSYRSIFSSNQATILNQTNSFFISPFQGRSFKTTTEWKGCGNAYLIFDLSRYRNT
ncbi:hypothetical protein [Facilibium subflavum]|uniref:hypothetical protein n=1 Tax=Facilibium subflavum TaxID=2219058 RepID=UPI0013C37B8C|nr:hypothetical protein [Facilibium subflavum]